MSSWMNDFVTRCLEGVPGGTYRDRTEKELRDHMEVLAWGLEKAGYTPVEAQAEALSRMGDPAELARNYVREWKRRTRWHRWLLPFEMFLFDICICVVGLLYVANERNFGKAWVSYWGIVAIIVAQFMQCSCLFKKTWMVTRWSCMVLVVIQLPPIFCWLTIGGPFEMSGVMVPTWAGFLVHTLFFLWAAANWDVIGKLQTEDKLAKIQSA